MGLLDSVLGSAMGGGQGGGGQQMLMQVIGMLLQGQGGGAQGGGGGLGGMLGGVLGSALGGGQAGSQASGGMGGLGGLGGLLAQLQQGGLGDAAQSWVSTGENMPVSGDQLSAALGADRIGAIAQQVGIPAGDLSSQLAQYLPQVIDKMTPNGQVPDGGADIGGLLGNVLGGLLKR